MRIPTKADWGEIDERDLDRKCAFEMFCGKSFAEAEKMFAEDAIMRSEDLLNMPSVPLNFYAPALGSYLLSESAEGDSDGASCFLRLVLWLLRDQKVLLAPDCERRLVEMAGAIALRQRLYDGDAETYGSFLELSAEIKRLAGSGR